MTKEKFEKIELEYGCGYWNVCIDHACPCSPTSAVGQGFDPEVYESMRKDTEKEVEDEYAYYAEHEDWESEDCEDDEEDNY